MDILNRLNATADVFASWGEHIALAFKNNKKDLEKEIKSLQGRMDAPSVAKFKEARRNLSLLLIAEETHWKQRAKVFWLQDNDSNSKFFHRMASARKKINTIDKLQDDGGSWITDQLGICEVVHNYFSQLFTANEQRVNDDDLLLSVRPTITEADNNLLTRAFRLKSLKGQCFRCIPISLLAQMDSIWRSSKNFGIW